MPLDAAELRAADSWRSRSPDASAAAYLQAISREPKAIKEALQHG